MDGIGGARGYANVGAPAVSDGSVSILRRASDAAKPETTDDGVAEAAGEDASAETSTTLRPIGNVGQHLDLRL